MAPQAHRAEPASGAEHRGALLLRVAGLSKSFPGLKALDDVSLQVAAGEIVSIVGQNGSGKSTLVKVLAGLHHPDPGAVVEVRDAAGDVRHPELHFIHQDLGLVPTLSTVENLDLGRRVGRATLLPVPTRREERAAAAAVARFGGTFDVRLPVGDLTAAERTIVAIARAMRDWSRPDCVLVLDEPTAALPSAEVGRLFDAIRRVAASGAGVLFISHHLDEVMELSDRVVALRDGSVVANLPVGEVDRDRLVTLIAGRAVADVEIDHSTNAVSSALTAEGLAGGTLHGVDLRIAAGEIVGVSGLLGSGREDLGALLFGALARSAGDVRVGDAPVRAGDPRAAIRRSMAFVPADRRRHGAVMAMSMRENLTLPRLAPLRRAIGRLDGRAERAEADTWVDAVGLQPALPDRPLELFSGGNQQKVVLAKWLRLAPQVLLLDEPTQGVDVGAKAAIYELLARAAQEGTAVLVSSSDTKELTLLCDRVLVLRHGRVCAELGRDALSEARLIHESLGIRDGSDPIPNPTAR
jgi:ABC-type sugar transport system ATPase subunit